MSGHVLVWEGDDPRRTEIAHVQVDDDRLSVHGTQIGCEPGPYQLNYRVETDAAAVTRRLQAEAFGDAWSRSIDLQRDERGRWACRSSAVGASGLAQPGGDVRALDAALDCELEGIALTSTLGIRRAGLDACRRGLEIVVVTVCVPSLLIGVATHRFSRPRARGGNARALLRRSPSDGSATDLLLGRDGFLSRAGTLQRISTDPKGKSKT